MLGGILLILIVLWFLGYVKIEGLTPPDIVLFTINGQPVTLWDLLIFVFVAWLVGLLPRPFREIATILLILWVLSTLGILAIAGLSQILLIAIIAGVILYLAGGSRY